MKFYEIEYIKDGKRQKMSLKANSKNDVKNRANIQGMIVKIKETQVSSINNDFLDLQEKFNKIFSSSKVKIPALVATIRPKSRCELNSKYRKFSRRARRCHCRHGKTWREYW